MLTVEKSIKFCNQVEFWDSNSLKKEGNLWSVAGSQVYWLGGLVTSSSDTSVVFTLIWWPWNHACNHQAEWVVEITREGQPTWHLGFLG